MNGRISRRQVRSILVSPYLVYPAGILAVILFYSLLFLLLQDNFNVRDTDFFTALYWVVISMTTTGYGDIYPVTLLGKLFSMLVVVTGLLILFAVVLPLMVTPIMERWIKNPRTRIPDWINNHVIICGYSAIVNDLILELTEKDIPFVVIEQSVSEVSELQRHGHYAIQGDPSDEDVLRLARIRSAAALISNEGDERNAAIVLTASQIADCKIIALVDSLDMAHYLEFAGADIVVSPKQILGMNIGLMAVSSINFELSSAVDLGGDVKICKLPVYPDNPMVGKRLREVKIREKTGANVVAILKNGDFMINPDPATVIDEATVLVVMGTGPQLESTGYITALKGPACSSHCIIAGFGDVGREVARHFDDKGITYTVIDRKQYHVQNQVIGDSSDKECLVKAGVETASTIVITLNDDARNMLTILLARSLNPHINIIARANINSSVGKMYRAGADYVMSLSAVAGQILARIVEKGSFDHTVALSDNVLLARFSVRGSKLENVTIKDSGMRRKTGCTIIGIRENDMFRPGPDPAEKLQEDAELIVVGTATQLEACQQTFDLKKVA